MRGWVTPCWEQQSPLGAEDAPGLPCWLTGKGGPTLLGSLPCFGSQMPGVALGRLSGKSAPASEPRALRESPGGEVGTCLSGWAWSHPRTQSSL